MASTICILGRVVEVTGQGLLLIEDSDGEKIEVEVDAETLGNLSIGDTGVFLGVLKHGKIIVSKIDARRFLSPLHEEDLAEAGSIIAIPVPNNPFETLFKSY